MTGFISAFFAVSVVVVVFVSVVVVDVVVAAVFCVCAAEVVVSLFWDLSHPAATASVARTVMAIRRRVMRDLPFFSGCGHNAGQPVWRGEIGSHESRPRTGE